MTLQDIAVVAAAEQAGRAAILRVAPKAAGTGDEDRAFWIDAAGTAARAAGAEGLTDSAQVEDFVHGNGTQLFAVAVGNVHGKYRGQPRLRWDILQDIAVRTHLRLMLHGASGIPPEELVKAAAQNVGKVIPTPSSAPGSWPRWKSGRLPTVPTGKTSRRCWATGATAPGALPPRPWACSRTERIVLVLAGGRGRWRAVATRPVSGHFIGGRAVPGHHCHTRV